MGNGNDSAFRMNASSRELAGKPQDLKRLMTALHQFWDIVISKAERQITRYVSLSRTFQFFLLTLNRIAKTRIKEKGLRTTHLA